MPEMTDTGEDHRHSTFVRCGNDLGIADRSARLDDRCRSRRNHGVEAVAEREERV